MGAISVVEHHPIAGVAIHARPLRAIAMAALLGVGIGLVGRRQAAANHDDTATIEAIGRQYGETQLGVPPAQLFAPCMARRP
jgi:hypothetical protein